jgi:methylmalonyl-CoA mutase
MTQEWISEFRGVTEEEWKVQLIKELKGDESKLIVQNNLEELSYKTFHYPNKKINELQNPTNLPVQRGFIKNSNHWRNGIQIPITNEVDANNKALNALMTGCDFIHFISTRKTNWSVVLKEIGLPYIHTSFSVSDGDDFISLVNEVGQDQLSFCSFDLSEITLQDDRIKNLVKTTQFSVIQIDGFSINQCGASAVQELGFVISKAKSALMKLMSNGLTIDEASACIHFKMGIGANYLVEISKFRSLKVLWANLIKAYEPMHNCSLNCQITAEVGWVNKSLKDPHTNLLRQTTEAMSAILGGIDRLIIHPYDVCSVNGCSELAQRMALNISNLLQNESYFASVFDALGGSYAIETITNELAIKSWDLFKKMDSLTLENQDLEWKKLIDAKVRQRIDLIRNSEMTLIGINKFPNPEKIDTSWSEPTTFLGMSYLRLETEF